ncbi:hypothetical protein J6590_071189 [Homalodisca vitripennis]|nr:hypothetical protein J6590_071189 [Homalodisca vitripennis]
MFASDKTLSVYRFDLIVESIGLTHTWRNHLAFHRPYCGNHANTSDPTLYWSVALGVVTSTLIFHVSRVRCLSEINPPMTALFMGAMRGHVSAGLEGHTSPTIVVAKRLGDCRRIGARRHGIGACAVRTYVTMARPFSGWVGGLWHRDRVISSCSWRHQTPANVDVNGGGPGVFPIRAGQLITRYHRLLTVPYCECPAQTNNSYSYLCLYTVHTFNYRIFLSICVSRYTSDQRLLNVGAGLVGSSLNLRQYVPEDCASVMVDDVLLEEKGFS